VAFTVTAGLVFFSNFTSRVNRLWTVFCLAVSVWGFGALLIGVTPDPALARGWWQIAHIGVIAIPVLFYHFVVAFAGLRRPRTLAAAYAAGGAFLAADATPWFINDVRQVFGQFYYDSPPSFLYILFVLGFVGLTLLSHVELWRARRGAMGRAQRSILQWFLTGTTVGYLGGATCFLPVFGIDLYPYGNFALPFFPLLMTVAFMRHPMMDVRTSLVRGSTFLLIYTLVVGLPFFVGARFQAIWQTALGAWWWVAPVALMGLLASVSPLLFLFMVQRLERRVWQAQRRYHRTLITASSGMTRVKEIGRLCRLIAYMVNRTVGLLNTTLFLYDAKEQRYFLRAARYRSLVPPKLSVGQGEPLIKLFQSQKDLVVLEELEAKLQGTRGEARARLELAYTWMRQLEARLIVPSFSDERLLAFLVLGAKRSGEPYTTDDIAIFSGLANQAALAIENAMVFEELRTNEAYMVQSEKLASIGQLASGMAHEIHNPLTIISGEAQLYLERFRNKDAAVDQLLQSIVEECKRAADITRRILRFAKPAPAEVSAVDLKAVVEESLALAGYQVRLERVERVVNVPDGLPKVRSNQNQLQEVLLNLILNACQAMGEKGGRLTVSAAANGSSSVTLTVEDTGPGIPLNIQRRIFDPFYTTKPTGTGLGLFVTQRILKSHGGSIALESEEGRGARFTIQLPVWHDAA